MERLGEYYYCTKCHIFYALAGTHTPPTDHPEEIKDAIHNVVSSQQPDSLTDQERERRSSLTALRALGVEPYAYAFERTHFSDEAMTLFDEANPDAHPTASIAGRIMGIRHMGKATFAHLQDEAGKIQIYFKSNELTERYDVLKLLDIGDIIGVNGFIFRTRTGEITLHVQTFEVLAKAIRPLPVVKEETDPITGEKIVHDAFSDKELRYRRRYSDLTKSIRKYEKTFRARAKIITTIRRFFDDRGYLEVETPILQPIYGGAYARPFVTHRNALRFRSFPSPLWMSFISNASLSAAFADGVYEIAKDFRKVEGMDAGRTIAQNSRWRRFPVSPMIIDEWMMSFTEQLFAEVARSVNAGSMDVAQRSDGTILLNFTHCSPPKTFHVRFGSHGICWCRYVSEMNEDELRMNSEKTWRCYRVERGRGKNH